jgi:hypothetical protein
LNAGGAGCYFLAFLSAGFADCFPKVYYSGKTQGNLNQREANISSSENILRGYGGAQAPN